MSRVSNSEIVGVRRLLRLLHARLRTHVDADYMQDLLKQIENTVESLIAAQHEQPEKSRFDMLYEVTKVLGTSLDLQTVLEQVMDVVIQLTGAEGGFLMLLSDDGVSQVQVARLYNRTNITPEERNYSRSIVRYALDKRESVLTSNATEDPRFAQEASIVKNALLSIMAVPLWARGNVIGVAYVQNQLVAGIFTQDDLEVLETVAAQAAIAIDNARLFSSTDQALSQRVVQLQELRRIDQRLSGMLDFDTAAHYLLEIACYCTDANRAFLGQKLLPEGPILQLAGYDMESGPLPNAKKINLSNRYPQLQEVWQFEYAAEFLEDGRMLLAVPVLREDRTISVILLQRDDGMSCTEEQRDMLERLVLRAAISLDNARLYSEVQAANQAKTDFVGIVAHDLKSPMSTILGSAELIGLHSGESGDDKVRSYAKRIINTVERMNALVSDLVDVSRIESGSFNIDNRPVDVHEVVKTVQETIIFDIQARKHTWVTNVASDIPKAWADFNRLVQVLTNLVSNAYKYTPNGGEISLSIVQQDDKLIFMVSDTGIGLSQDQIDNLGTKFWRAPTEFVRKQPGTGLGFGIARMIIEQMGSSISIESEVGKGSRFSFSVPIARLDHKEPGIINAKADLDKVSKRADASD